MTSIVIDTALPAGTYTLTPSGVQLPGPVVPPAPVPVAPPVATNCNAYPPFGQGDYNWPKLIVGGVPFPEPAAVGTGPAGGCISFTTDHWNMAAFPEGIVFQVLDDAGQVEKEICVSECPHSFVPVKGQAAGRNVGRISYQGLSLKFPGQKPAGPNDCIVEANKTYFFNFRAVDQVSETRLQLVGQQWTAPVSFF